MTQTLYFEDFHAGRTFTAGDYAVTKEAVIAFATEFDPQYFHLDEEAAKKSFFKKLAASGWHTAAISMRLKTQTDLVNVAGGLIGMGAEAFRWPRPVYPGDTLRLVITVTDARASTSKPDRGIVKYRMETFNQHDELVLEAHTAVIVPKRAA